MQYRTLTHSMSIPSSENFFNTLGVTIQRRKGTRRMTLRMHPVTRALTLSLPMRGSLREAERFLREKQSWIAKQLSKLPETVPFADGSVIPILGELYRIVHQPSTRGVVKRVEDQIIISGAAEHLPRRLRDWLKQELKREATAIAMEKAAILGVKVRRVGVRDTSSRWGSCSSNGHLSFSWRLMLSPREVMGYVVAHEVAHLREMNHSAKFWARVSEICPDWERHYAWLRDHNAELYRYG